MSGDTEFLSALSVDCVIFGFDEGELKVLLIKKLEAAPEVNWALPGGLVKVTESLDEAAKRILQSMAGVTNIYTEQVHTFGDVSRHPQRRVVSVSYYGLIKISDYPIESSSDNTKGVWHTLSALPSLMYDHEKIIRTSLTHLKEKVKFHPVGFELLPEKFTLTQLQNLYEVIIGRELDKRNFRKKILGMDLIVKTSESQKGVAHRAAAYFRFDPERYNDLKEQGFSFKL